MANRNEFKLIILPAASDEIYELHLFYEMKRSGFGDEFMDLLGDCLNNILEFPETWQYARTKEEGIRRALLKKHPVVILYKVVEKEIRILAVKDTRSNWL